MKLFHRNYMNSLNISRKFTVIMILGVILPFIIVSLIFSRQILLEIRGREHALIESAQRRIEDNLVDALDNAKQISYTYVLNYELNELLSITQPISDYLIYESYRELSHEIHEILRAYDYISSISIYHNNPLLPDSSDIQLISNAVRQQAWYVDYVNSARSMMIFEEMDPANYQLRIVRRLNANVFYDDNYVEIVLNPQALNRLVEDSFLIDNDYNIYVLNARDQIILQRSASNGPSSDDSIYPLSNADNPDLLIHPLHGFDELSDWQMVIETNNQLNRRVNQNILILILLVSVIFALALLIFYILSRSITRRLQKMNTIIERMDDSQVDILQGDFGNDEIGHTAQKLHEMHSQIHQLIYKDPLTHLDNRRAITDKIDAAILQQDHAQNFSAVLFLDVDNFKDINDTHGHDIGDKIIQVTGHRMRKIQQPFVEIGRFGGDEFIVLITHCPSMDRVHSLLQQVHELFIPDIVVEHRHFHLTVSIGVAVHDVATDTRKDLIKKADLALYKAKSSGKNRYVFYDANMTDQLKEKLHIRNTIRKAFHHDEFEMYYQPYYYTQTHEIAGFEALIRWPGQRNTAITPYELIQHAEAMGLIDDLGLWIFDQACQFAQRVNPTPAQVRIVSINISPIQLIHPQFYDQIMEIIGQYGIQPELLCLEMTETMLITSMTKGMNTIQQLKDHGFRIAIDDFGTGYSSLSYLNNLPIDTLKIDKSFIQSITQEGIDQDLVDLIITVAHKKNLTVIAEGVETREQLQKLDAYQCDIIQGYYFSKPLDQSHAMAALNISSKP